MNPLFWSPSFWLKVATAPVQAAPPPPLEREREPTQGDVIAELLEGMRKQRQ